VVVPILLGRGVRLWDGLEGLEKDYEIEATSSPSGVTHATFIRAGVRTASVRHAQLCLPRATASVMSAAQRSGSSRKGRWLPGVTSRRASGISSAARRPIAGPP
jgi:hypothetical protein